MINEEIFHDECIDLTGKYSVRKAVRALVNQDDKLLLLYSDINNDYKFPGGGIEYKEDHIDALKRELMEECGVSLIDFGDNLGLMVEYRKAREESLAFFKMESYYYFCTIGTKFSPQDLDDYEKEIKLRPVWVTAKEALNNNKQILENENPPPWCKRDTMFLERIIENGLV